MRDGNLSVCHKTALLCQKRHIIPKLGRHAQQKTDDMTDLTDLKPSPDVFYVPAREWRAIQALLRGLVMRVLMPPAFLEQIDAAGVVLSAHEIASALQPGLNLAIDYIDGRTIDGGVRLRLYREVDPNQGAQPIQG